MDKGRKPCRCLLGESFPEMQRSIAEYVSLLPEEQKAAPEVYAARLAVCRQCEHLRDGTCALCGCYVEARAAKKNMNCPDVPGRWTSVSVE